VSKPPQDPCSASNIIRPSSRQQLDQRQGITTEEADSLHIDLSEQQRRQHGLNKMDALAGSYRDTGDADPELIEELMAGSSGHQKDLEQQLHGLQQFRTEKACKVVYMKTAQSKKDSSAAAVLAAGVGWGLKPNNCISNSGWEDKSASPPALLDVAEKGRLEVDLVKKRQIRGVRKAFGLEPTVLHDTSAQVIECGAGKWQ
jgi:hypothetical protein